MKKKNIKYVRLKKKMCDKNKIEEYNGSLKMKNEK